jgi:hypothetical protein
MHFCHSRGLRRYAARERLKGITSNFEAFSTASARALINWATGAAMGPFYTTATGLHGLTGFSTVSAGGAGVPITLGVSKLKSQIASGIPLLLKVVPGSE